ncbi:DUF6221 family protein [Nocardia sp. CC227C]|uniref:DUF6221 family protein n=1 Tax=Nocardia sp. CC227C TaxID=3044562 RepID=UPI00278BB5AE|nr:DUF6221 family protein [Nocardia sp. CC227C]
MTIAVFINARLTEREQLARDATELPAVTPKYPAKKPPWEPEQWRVDSFGDVVTVNGASNPLHADCGGGPRSEAVAQLIAANDPAAVLREVAFQRGVLGSHASFDGQWCNRCSPMEHYPCPELRGLAAIWREHADYRPEWANDRSATASNSGG